MPPADPFHGRPRSFSPGDAFCCPSIGGEDFFDAGNDDLSEYVSDTESVRSAFRGGGRPARRLEEECRKRAQAEAALAAERDHVAALSALLQSQGLPLPSLHAPTQEAAEVVVARMVGAAIARGVALAEREEAVEAMVAGKDRDLGRLRDKMQYWERMNAEMANQSQESIEVLRSQRRRRERVQKGLLAALGVVCGIGLSAGVAFALAAWDRSPGRLDPQQGSIGHSSA